MKGIAMSFIEYTVTDRIAKITLNRPDKLNAINRAMREELFSVFADFAAREDAWVAVITGTGTGVLRRSRPGRDGRPVG